MIGVIAGQYVAPISCAYPFNATNADAIAFGAEGAMVASNAGKTATYTVQSGVPHAPSNFVLYAQLIMPRPTTVDFSTGKKVAEFGIDISGVLTGGIGNAAIIGGISIPAGPRISTFRINLLDDGSTSFIIFNSASATISVPGVTYPAVVGLCIDADTSTFTLQINGADIDISAGGFNSYTPLPGEIIIGAIESTAPNAIDAADAGITLSLTLRAAASDITQTYAVGATDLCGNPL